MAISNVQSDMVEDVVIELSDLNEAFTDALIVNQTENRPNFEESAKSSQVREFVQKEMQMRDVLQPKLPRNKTVIDSFDYLYNLYFDPGNAPLRDSSLFISVLSCAMRTRIVQIQRDSALQQMEMKALAMTYVAKCEADCANLKASLCILDIRGARARFNEFEKTCTEFFAALPPSQQQFRTEEMLSQGSEVLKSPGLALNFRNGHFAAVGTEILHLYYKEWPRSDREKMPFLLLFRMIVEKALDNALELITVTKRKMSQIAAPHKADGHVVRENSEHVDIPGGENLLVEMIASIAEDAVASTICARIVDLNQGLWMVQDAFDQLLMGFPDQSEQMLQSAHKVLEKVGLHRNYYFVQVSQKRMNQLRSAQNSIQSFFTASRILVDRPEIPDRSLQHVCGQFHQAFIARAKDSSLSGGGWRLRSNSVDEKLKQMEQDNLLFFASVIFCDVFGSKFTWAMLLTNLNNHSCHLLLNDNPLEELPPALFDILPQLKLVTLDLSCCALTSLPNKIQQLTDLRHLMLHSNKLKRLPATLGYLHENIETLTLKDNMAFQFPPQEIVAKGRQLVLHYLAERVKHGRPYKATKLVLLGIDETAPEIALQSLLGDNGSPTVPVVAHSGIGLCEWTPQLADGMTLTVYTIGMKTSSANIYNFVLTNQASYALAWNVCNIQHHVPGSREHREALKSTVRAITEKLNDLYMQVPGISILLIATHDGGLSEENIRSQVLTVQEAVETLIKRQQAEIDDCMRCGNVTKAKPLKVHESGLSVIINWKDGHGVAVCRQHIFRQAASLHSYGDIILPAFHHMCKRIRCMQTEIPTTRWLTWERFVDLAAECRACPTASLYAAVCQEYNRNPFTLRFTQTLSVPDSSDGNACREGSTSETIHLLEPQETFQLCRIQTAVRRARARFLYVSRIRRILNSRVCAEMQQVAVFLHEAGAIHFHGLAQITQMSTYRSRKTEIVEQLMLFNRASIQSPSGQKHRALLEQELVDLKIKMRGLRRSLSQTNNNTIFISPAWMIDVVKGLTNESLSALHRYLTSSKNMKLVLALETMMSSGVIIPDLIPYLWPTSNGSDKYWDSIRSTDWGQTMWPKDVFSAEEDLQNSAQFHFAFLFLESIDLMHQNPEGNYVAAIHTRARSQTMPAAAYCDHTSPFKAHLVYNMLPRDFLSRAIFLCRKVSQHVECNDWMAVFFSKGKKAIVSVVDVKDPATVLPNDVLQAGKKNLSENNWKSDDIEKALLKKTSGQSSNSDELDAAIDKLFKDFQKDSDGDLGGLELDVNEVGQGLKSLGVLMSKQDTESLFARADKDGGGTIDGREFRMMVRSLFRQSQYKRLKPDQVHVIVKCSTASQLEQFLHLLGEVQAMYPGLLQTASIQSSGEEDHEAKQVAMCYSPKCSRHLFDVEKRQQSLVVVNCQNALTDLLGVRPENFSERNVLDILHPNVKKQFEEVLNSAMLNSLSSVRLVFTCGIQFRIRTHAAELGASEEECTLVAGTVGMLRNSAKNYAAANWKIRDLTLTEDGFLRCYNEAIGAFQAWSLKGCTVRNLAGIRDPLMPRGCHPFVLEFDDGGCMTFAARSKELQTQWCSALQTACNQDIIPVNIISEKPNLLHIESGLASFIAYHLKQDHISVSDRTEELDRRKEEDIENIDKAHSFKMGNMPKVAIAIIDENYFGDENCLSDFESYTSGVFGHVSLLPVLAPGFEIAMNPRTRERNFTNWWPVKKQRKLVLLLASSVCSCSVCAWFECLYYVYKHLEPL